MTTNKQLIPNHRSQEYQHPVVLLAIVVTGGAGIARDTPIVGGMYTVWALLIFLASQPPAAVAERMEMDPSELPQARIRP